MTEKKVDEEKLRPVSQSSHAFNFPKRSPRSVKTSSSVVRSEKYKYFRDMNKQRDSEPKQKILFDIQRN